MKNKTIIISFIIAALIISYCCLYQEGKTKAAEFDVQQSTPQACSASLQSSGGAPLLSRINTSPKATNDASIGEERIIEDDPKAKYEFLEAMLQQKFYIQLETFYVLENAEKSRVNSFRYQPDHLFIGVIDMQQGVYSYRLLLGQFDTFDEAQTFLRQQRMSGLIRRGSQLDGFVVY